MFRKDIETKLEELLKEYKSQFAQDETTFGMTPLTKTMKDTRDSKPVSQKLYPIAMKCYKWVKDKINKLLTADVIWGSQSSWSAPNIVVPKGNGGKCIVIDYHALNKITRKCFLAYAKSRIFSQLNGTKYFSALDPRAGYHHIPLDKSLILKTTFTSPFGKYEYIKVPSRCFTGFPFHHCLPGWHNHLQQDSRGTPTSHQTSFWEITDCSLISETQQMSLLCKRNPVP